MDLGWSDRDEALAAELASLSRSGMYRRPIALAGFMGVGKSSLGRLLSEVLERPFYDTDSWVEEAAGRTIDSFFPDEEPEFRRREADAVAELLTRGPSVIALGGGALLNDRSRRLLRERSLLVHLHVPWRELSGHIPSLIASRPLLRGRTLAEIHRLYLVRLATYRQASLRITVGRRGTAEAATDVLRALRSLEGPAATSDRPLSSRTEMVLKALARARSTSPFELERTV
jgi:shikimate kinase